jgi:hypothetical protein
MRSESCPQRALFTALSKRRRLESFDKMDQPDQTLKRISIVAINHEAVAILRICGPASPRGNDDRRALLFNPLNQSSIY